jgi:type II secretory pathway pseudopilin PulG
MLYTLIVLIILAVLAVVAVTTLVYLRAAEWVTRRYDAWMTQRLVRRAAAECEEPDQNISMW